MENIQTCIVLILTFSLSLLVSLSSGERSVLAELNRYQDVDNDHNTNMEMPDKMTSLQQVAFRLSISRKIRNIEMEIARLDQTETELKNKLESIQTRRSDLLAKKKRQIPCYFHVVTCPFDQQLQHPIPKAPHTQP